MPNDAHIVPNLCNDRHGIAKGPDVPRDCTNEDQKALIARGDAAIGRIVARIMAAPFWSGPGNSAIVVTFDEDGKPRDPADRQGCCGYEPGSLANFGGAHIATTVITNHGPRKIADETFYNHNSLLRTAEQAFGIDEYLNYAGAVTPMARLFQAAP